MPGGLDVHPGYNVVLHEFAHQLDAEDGITSGTPLLGKCGIYSMWNETLHFEFNRLRKDYEDGRPTVLDNYGAESPAEFFAVATEAFFETPLPVRERHTELYRELVRYYRQDPAQWPAIPQEHPQAP